MDFSGGEFQRVVVHVQVHSHGGNKGNEDKRKHFDPGQSGQVSPAIGDVLS